jgi:hypothetical protein
MVSDIPDSEVGKVNNSNAFALPFIFPSKKEQKLLINAQSLIQSAKQGTTIGRNPTSGWNEWIFLFFHFTAWWAERV